MIYKSTHIYGTPEVTTILHIHSPPSPAKQHTAPLISPLAVRWHVALTATMQAVDLPLEVSCILGTGTGRHSKDAGVLERFRTDFADFELIYRT